MGILGKGTNRGRRAIGLVVAVTATAVLLVAASPSSADSTGINISVINSVATEGGAAATFEVSRVGADPLTEVVITSIALTGDTSRVQSVSPTPISLTDANPTATITVTAEDDIYQGPTPGSFNLRLTPSVGVEKDVSGTIVDNESQPTISINDRAVTEGDPPTSTSAPFTVTLSGRTSQAVNVFWSPGAGTATAGQDFTMAGGGTVSFPANTTTLTQTIAVSVIGDLVVEPTETYSLNLTSNSAGFVMTKTQGTGTITDNDVAAPPPTVSIGDIPVNEADGVANIPVTLSSAAGPGGVQLTALTADGTASAAQPDYGAGTPSVTIPPGESSGVLAVQIVSDNIDENAEAFTVSLTNATGATIADGSATVTINDTGNVSRLDVSDAASVNEPGTGGTVNAIFNVTLSAVSARTVTVPYGTASGTATSPDDFTPTSGTLTFLPGQTSKPVTVVVKGDAVNEANETFKLVLGAASGAVVGDGEGLALIVDPSAPPALTIADVAGDEGAGSITVTVTLSGAATAQTVTVDYATAVGTAGAADFTATTGTATFAPGVTTQTFSIPIVNDTIAESDETFTVTLSNPVGATLAKNKATVRIVDNDTGPGGTATPVGTKPPTTTTTPKPPTTTTPAPVVRTLQVKLLWVKLDGKVDGKARAAIRVSLAQLVNARIVMVQGKRKITSSQFQIKRGNRTIYVVLPAFVKKGKVQLQLVMTTAQGAAKTLRTTVTLKAPVKLTAAQKKAAAKKAAAKKAAAKKAAAKKAAAKKAAAAKAAAA